MRVADVIAERLAAASITRIYGLPGGEMLDLLEATRRVGIHFVLTHHEAAAAFMAAAEGCFRRSPAACISTLGPGATNLISGIAHAYLDRSPVIALTADLPTTLGPDYTHQRIDLPRLFAPVTKRSYLVNAESAISIVDEAFKLAGTEPFGPVSLHVPRDVAGQMAGAKQPQSQATRAGFRGDLSLESVAARLNSAKRPLVLVGLGAPHDAADEIRRFIEAYSAPAGATPKVKGIVDEAHPLWTGTFGGMMAEGLLVDFIRECDLVLGIGLEPTELDRVWPVQDRFVWLLGSPNVGQSELPPNSWCGPLEEGLQTLAGMLTTRRTDGHAEAARVRQSIRGRLHSGVSAQLAGMSPLHALDTLAAIWPRSDTVCCDVGAHKLLIGQAWPASVPNRFFMSNGISSMGYGVAAPIALSLAADHAPVLAVIGDGGLLMYAGELETAVRERARVLYVVFCDSSLALIESSQRRRNYPLYGMRFTALAVTQLSAAFGLPAWQVGTKDELTNAVRAFRDVEGPAMIGVSIDPREYDVQNS